MGPPVHWESGDASDTAPELGLAADTAGAVPKRRTSATRKAGIGRTECWVVIETPFDRNIG
jgi:hypothetical protein